MGAPTGPLAREQAVEAIRQSFAAMRLAITLRRGQLAEARGALSDAAALVVQLVRELTALEALEETAIDQAADVGVTIERRRPS